MREEISNCNTYKTLRGMMDAALSCRSISANNKGPWHTMKPKYTTLHPTGGFAAKAPLTRGA